MLKFYENIVLPLDLGIHTSTRSKLAVNLSARFGARVIGIAAREVNRPHGHGKGGIITSKMVDSEKRHTFHELSLVEKAFREEAKNLKDLEVFLLISDPQIALIDKTRTADLVLCNRPYEGDLDDWFADLSPGALLMRLGCPLLVVPLGLDELVGRRIVIAWKDTREARRAVREAWPFIRTAEAVFVVTIGSDAEAVGALDISDAIRNTGTNCRTILADKTRARVSAEILKIAAEERADLIVAGAYGHARVHELIYGSVTRDLLEHSPISCFLSR